MAAKINWHGYGTKLRHCHAKYSARERRAMKSLQWKWLQTSHEDMPSRVLHIKTVQSVWNCFVVRWHDIHPMLAAAITTSFYSNGSNTPHRCRTQRFIVFAKWRQCTSTPLYNARLLGHTQVCLQTTSRLVQPISQCSRSWHTDTVNTLRHRPQNVGIGRIYMLHMRCGQ